MANKLPKLRTAQVWCARVAESDSFHAGDRAREQAAAMPATDHDLEHGMRWVGFTLTEHPIVVTGGAAPLRPGEVSTALASRLHAAFPDDEVCISIGGTDFDYPFPLAAGEED